MAKQKLVVLSGAGISAESGLKTFRDSDGLWENLRVEDVATPGAWKRDPHTVLKFYNERRKNVADATPNAAHFGLAELEEYYDVHIVTQNIDDLHERAGSTNVMHLHGEITKMRSEKNEHLIYPFEKDILWGDVSEDGAQLRPFIVWFEEPVPMIEAAIPIMQAAEIFVVIGTSLAVYPAAGLVDFVKPGVKKFVIDRALPPMWQYQNVVSIEMPATKGIAVLFEHLGIEK